VRKSHIILFLIVISAAINPLNAAVPDFRKMIEDYLSLVSVKASITQKIYLEDGSTEVYSGNYFAASKGFIRIDYLLPESQTIVVNDSGLFWYYNDRNLLFVSGKKRSSNDSIPVLMSVISRESLKDIDIISEGVKFYSFFKMAEIYSITSKKNKTKMVIWVDPVLKIIKRKYILDETGREMIKEEYIGHTVIDGIYIPSKIDLKARTSGGVVHTVTEYSGIVINIRLDKDLFKFKVTQEMKVRVLNDK